MEETLADGEGSTAEAGSDRISSRGVTHTFRLDSDVRVKLDELSKQQGKSVNALANRALRKLVEWDADSTRAGYVTLSPRLLTKIMEYLSEEEAREFGRWASINMFSDLVQSLFQKNSLSSVIGSLAMLDKYAQAFTLDHSFRNGTHTLILLHKMGSKWSAFYEEVVSSLFHQITEPVRKVSTTSSDNQVVVSIEIEPTP